MRRKLSTKERDAAQLVFADNLTYDRIWIYEDTPLPLWIARIGALISKGKTPARNAITLGNRTYFSDVLHTSPFDIQNMKLSDMAWLIHELTHVWQYQHIGSRYLYDAIRVQIRLGKDAYDYGSEDGLKDAYASGKTLLEFNPEQQGEIARDYYLRIKEEKDVSAWEPFILELKTLPM